MNKIKKMTQGRPLPAQQAMIRLLGIVGIPQHFTPVLSANTGLPLWRYHGHGPRGDVASVIHVSDAGAISGLIVGMNEDQEAIVRDSSDSLHKVSGKEISQFFMREVHVTYMACLRA